MVVPFILANNILNPELKLVSKFEDVRQFMMGQITYMNRCERCVFVKQLICGTGNSERLVQGHTEAKTVQTSTFLYMQDLRVRL